MWREFLRFCEKIVHKHFKGETLKKNNQDYVSNKPQTSSIGNHGVSVFHRKQGGV